MRKLKIWGGLLHRPGGQYRTIVAARTKKKALQFLGLADNTPRDYSLHHFNGYWHETGNAVELSVCSNEQGVWVSKLPISALGSRVAEDYIHEVKWCGHLVKDGCGCWRDKNVVG